MEVLETETHRVRDWLHLRAKALRSSADDGELDRVMAYVLAPDGGSPQAVSLTEAAERPGRGDALQRENGGNA